MKTWVRKSIKVGILSAGFLLIGGAAANAASTTDNFGILGGNQVHAPIQAPISISGNAIGLLGTAHATGSGASTSGGAGGAGSTSDNFAIGTGNQVTADISLPIDVCGNAVSLLGGADASCGDSGSTGGGSGNGGYGTGTGSGSGGYGTGTGSGSGGYGTGTGSG